MSSGITAHIRLKEHLRLFYRSTSGEPVVIDKKRKFFNFVIHASLELRKDFRYSRINEDDFYVFEIPLFSDKDITTGSYFIPERYFEHIERQLEMYFDMSYVSHITACDNIKEAIYGFCDIHGMPITDKLYEMLKKRYYRDRLRIEVEDKKNYKKITHKVSLICPEIVPC